ncbi:uncharacterized protein BDW70DRAFT_131398 [Aspergillus foveolatus]|uniref:uncharacterized protein n=1 Tax=Aspergillus foveolatus TaxID=210207 RepID=UPI003CCE2E63
MLSILLMGRDPLRLKLNILRGGLDRTTEVARITCRVSTRGQPTALPKKEKYSVRTKVLRPFRSSKRPTFLLPEKVPRTAERRYSLSSIVYYWQLGIGQVNGASTDRDWGPNSTVIQSECDLGTMPLFPVGIPAVAFALKSV